MTLDVGLNEKMEKFLENIEEEFSLYKIIYDISQREKEYIANGELTQLNHLLGEKKRLIEAVTKIEEEVNMFLEYIRKEFFEGKEEEFELRRKSLVRISPAKIIKIEKENENND